MEVRDNRQSKDSAQAERRAAIVELWVELGKPAVDARVLKAIQSSLVGAFGDGVTEGPAEIARLLADEGAELKHPEIIETDAEWRQAWIETNATQSDFEQLAAPEVMTRATAEKFIHQLEELRRQNQPNEDARALTRIRAIAVEARRLAESIARNRLARQTVRIEQAEIAEWLKVWLQTPALFKEWLELRKRSDEFRARFSNR